MRYFSIYELKNEFKSSRRDTFHSQFSLLNSQLCESAQRCGGNKRDHAHDHADRYKDHPDLDLGPAAHLKVVMDGGHLEDAAALVVGAEALGELEVPNLEDDGQGLHDVDQTHQHQDQRHIQGKGHTADRAAQEEGAGVAHEDLRRVEVVAEEAQEAADQRGGEDGQLRLLDADGRHQEEDHDRDGDAGGQAVDAVGQIHCVDAAHDHKDREGNVDPDGDLADDIREGDPEIAAQILRLIAGQIAGQVTLT